MSADFQLEAEAVFLAALGAEPDGRRALLEERCANDAVLRAEVESLLSHHKLASDFLGSPAAVGLDGTPADFQQTTPPSASAIPERIASYRVLSLLGEGGMAVVYLAEQDKPRRQVALKLLRPGIATPEQLHRFEKEAEILGRLHHPGIAQVFEAGTAQVDGRTLPYIAMERVEGRPLTVYAEAAGLETRQRLKLLVKVCQAVDHAHQNGVIHRDLKPANILVVEEGTGNREQGTERITPASVPRSLFPVPFSAQPKILDFGIARATDADVRAMTLQTNVGQLIGTVAYMSPEQASGNPALLDARSDVYTLGVIGYELLTGRLPYDVSQKMIHEAVRVIREDDPSSLSLVNRTFRGDLDTIFAKALEKEKTRRYPSAAALTADLRRYLNHEPVLARPASAVYQFRKFARRNRVPVAVAALFVVLLGVFAVVASVQAQRNMHLAQAAEAARAREAEQRQLADQRRLETEQVAGFQQEQLSGIDVQALGLRLRADLLANARAAAERSKRPAEEVDARIGELEKLIAGADFTGMALSALDENIFSRALAAMEKKFADQPLVKARLLQALAETLRQLGLLNAAVRPQAEALAIRRGLLGEEHPDTLHSINDMGCLLQAQGKLGEAEGYFREAVEKYRRVLGDERPETLIAIHNFGSLLEAQGKRREAEGYCREVLERLRRVLGDEHPSTLTSIHRMGSLLQAQGKLGEAEGYCREALEKRRRVLGNEHPDTLASTTTMGSLMQAQGKLDQAEPYYREALESYRRVLGDEHPDTLTSISYMGFVLQAQGKLGEAEGYCREALEKYRRVLGEEHPDTLSSINNMGQLLRAQGKLADAEVYHREALETRRRVLGEEHPETLTSLNNMGTLLEAQGKLGEAEGYYRESLEKTRRVLGEEHPETLTSINNMGFLLQTQGKLGEAEDYWRAALEKTRRLLGDEHPDTLISISNLGALLQVQGKLAEAESYCREALDKRRRVLGDEHPDTLIAINNMGSLLQARGKLAEAEPYYREALDKSRRLLGEEHPDTLTSINNMGALLKAQGKLAEAERYYREALEKSRQALGEEHPSTLISICNMGSLLKAQSKLSEAEPYYREALEKSRQALGEEHPIALVSISNMGGLLQAQGKPTEAVALLVPAEPAERRAFTGGNAWRLGRFLTALGRARAGTGAFDAAQDNLTEAHAILMEAKGATQQDRAEVLSGLVELYHAWHGAEPDKGHDAKAAEWRERLAEWQASQETGNS